MPGGHYVAAWQPLVEPDWDRVAELALGITEKILNRDDIVGKNIAYVTKKDGPAAGAIAAKDIEKAKKVFEKRKYTLVTKEKRLSHELLFKSIKREKYGL